MFSAEEGNLQQFFVIIAVVLDLITSVRTYKKLEASIKVLQ